MINNICLLYMNKYASMMSGGKKTKKRKIQYGGVPNEEWMNFNKFFQHVKALAEVKQKPDKVCVKTNNDAGNGKINIFISAEGVDGGLITLNFHDQVKAGEDYMPYNYHNDEEEGDPNMMFKTQTFTLMGGQKKTKKRKRRRKLKKKRKSKKKRKTRKKRKLRKKRKSVKN